MKPISLLLMLWLNVHLVEPYPIMPIRPLPPGCNIDYSFHSRKLIWSMAERKCRREFGTLAIISDMTQQSTIRERFGHYQEGIWIGASDRWGQYRWVDGNPLIFTAWTPGQPDREGPGYYERISSCVQINYLGPGLWDDADCAFPKAFLCEIITCNGMNVHRPPIHPPIHPPIPPPFPPVPPPYHPPIRPPYQRPCSSPFPGRRPCPPSYPYPGHLSEREENATTQLSAVSDNHNKLFPGNGTTTDSGPIDGRLAKVGILNAGNGTDKRSNVTDAEWATPASTDVEFNATVIPDVVGFGQNAEKSLDDNEGVSKSSNNEKGLVKSVNIDKDRGKQDDSVESVGVEKSSSSNKESSKVLQSTEPDSNDEFTKLLWRFVTSDD